jgi:hypothetical protein
MYKHHRCWMTYAICRVATCALLLSPGTLLAEPPEHEELLRLHRAIVEAMIVQRDVGPLEQAALDQVFAHSPGRNPGE